MCPVDQVVARHYRPWIRVLSAESIRSEMAKQTSRETDLDRNLEGLEVDFPKRTLAHMSIDAEAFGFLFIDCIVFYRSTYPLAL